MFSFGANKQTARVAGEFYVNAINVMRGAEALSTYAPIPESEKFRIEYWALEEAKLAAHAQAEAARRPDRLRHRRRLGHRPGDRRTGSRPRAPASSSPTSTRENAEAVARELGGTDVAISVRADVTDEEQVADAFRRAVLAFGGVDLVVNNAGLSISKPLLETTVADWDLQHDVMARGSFLVSREAARIMIDQAMGGDLVYIVSKNAFFAGPNNVAYGAAKADQAHQVRLLAAELGQFGIRVNGVNPDGVVRGSGIFAKGWGADRARTYGIPEDKLGEFYAQRTLLKREVLPEHVAAAVFALDRRRPQPDDGPPHPRRRGCRGGLPPVTGRLVAAVDLGASSGRVMVGRVAPNELELTEVHRFANDPVRLPDGLHWDILRLYHEVLAGLREAARTADAADGLVSVAVDSWAVDYGLLDAAGSLLGNPFHYRDGRNAAGVAAVHRRHRAGRALRPERSPGHALQHALPAGGVARHGGIRDGPADAADPGPDRVVAVRRPGHRGDECITRPGCSTSTGGPGTRRSPGRSASPRACWPRWPRRAMSSGRSSTPSVARPGSAPGRS